MIECVIPILNVAELGRSVAFYEAALGFQVDWEAGGMAGLSREGHQLYLCEGGQGSPGTWIWIGVEDFDSAFAALRAAGAVVMEEPVNYPWAYEARVQDPDGHMLRIGAEPRDEE